MSAYIYPLLSVVVGAFLGFVSTLLISNLRQRQDITLHLLKEYFQVRKEIVNVVTDLANLPVRQPLDPARREEYREAVSKLFYKHFDLLQKEVLDSLSCLDACLQSADGKLYILDGKAVVAMKDEEVIKLIKRITLYDNVIYFAPLALRSKDANIRANQAIALQARNVLFTLNNFLSVKDLLLHTKRLKKESGI